jgi:hypothetical protein
MRKTSKGQAGFAHVVVVLVIAVALVAVVGLAVRNFAMKTPANGKGVAKLAWSNKGDGWVKSGTVPACASPLAIPAPVDLTLATEVLYPGQYRGGNYKPHGGFIFRGSANNAITVKAPLDAYVYKASRYIEAGEVQYMFVFIAPCGIMYRFDHLATLSPAFQALADTLPAAQENNSETTNFDKPPVVKAGDAVATSVGFVKTGNTSVDFGVYDLRAKNAVSQIADWQKKHPMEHEFGAYAICWLDNITGPGSAGIKALPGGDGQAGKQSDYCK